MVDPLQSNSKTVKLFMALFVSGWCVVNSQRLMVGFQYGKTPQP
jgi:hypothetical protein